MNIMKRAWEIAKEGVAKFGGKAKDYFAQSLKMAWAEARMMLKQFAAFGTKAVRTGSMVKNVSTLPQNIVTGTDKQVAWAQSIRAQFNADIHNFLATAHAQNRLSVKMFMEFTQVARALFLDKTSASFWIDNRNQKIEKLVAAYRKELMA